jgi:plastocyanin
MSLSPRRSFLLSSVFLASLLGGAGAAKADEPVTVITLKDHAFAPAEVEIPAGVKVKLVVRNDSPASAEFESHALHREKVVKAGAEISLPVGPLTPGSYEFFDDFHPQTRGHLIVK